MRKRLKHKSLTHIMYSPIVSMENDQIFSRKFPFFFAHIQPICACKSQREWSHKSRILPSTILPILPKFAVLNRFAKGVCGVQIPPPAPIQLRFSLET